MSYKDNYLSALASALCARQVHVESTNISTAAFDHSNRRILINSKAPYDAARGLLAHEILHERFTEFADWQATMDMSPYNNLVEDVRINLYESTKVYKNAIGWIYDTWTWLLQGTGQKAWKPSAPSMTWLYLAHQQPMDPMPWDAEVSALWAKHQSPIKSARAITELRAVMEELRDLDKKYQKDQPQQPPTGEGDNPQPPQQPKGRGKGGRLTKKQQEEYNRAVREYYKAVEAKRVAESMEGIGSPLHGMKEATIVPPGGEKGEKGGGSAKCGQLDNTYRILNEPCEPEAMAKLRGWRNRMCEALMSTAAGAPTRNLPRGRLDGTKLHHIAGNTSDRVFAKNTTTRRAVNTAVDIMLDTSGSTAGRCEYNLAAAAYALAEACSRVPGVKLGLLQFGSGCQRLLPIAHNRTVRLEQAQASSYGGGTETDMSMLHSAADLRMVPDANRRICINCTDGAEANPQTLAIMEGLGIEYYELHLIDDASVEYVGTKPHQHATTIDQIHNGLDRLVRTLRIKGH